MCGIAGFFGEFGDDRHRDRRRADALLLSMAAAIAHRGPDDRGVWSDPSPGARVGLAHTRLSILDLSPDGHQPMASPDGRLQIVYNGEIYNFRELKEQLAARGHQFRTRSDTEVLLHLYQEYGAGMLERLEGIFAFALWDGHSRELLLARDGFGVKPLYWTAVGGGGGGAVSPAACAGVVFASELKALLVDPAVPRSLDPVALHHHLAFLWSPAPRTMLAGVQKLEPGCAMTLRGGRVVRRWCFYDQPYDGARADGSRAELAAELRELLEASVRRQMVSDAPLGAFLSGGLDSSAIVAMMARTVGESAAGQIPCYAIGFAGPDGTGDGGLDGAPSDLPYARMAARHLGVRLSEIRVGPDMIDNLERTLFHLDEPQADPAPINTMLIAAAARRDGIKVLLSGAGGDDVMSGYRRHQALLAESLWDRFPGPARTRLAAWSKRVSPSRGPWARRLSKLLRHVDEDGEGRVLAHFLWSSEAARRGLYGPALAGALERVDTLAPLRASLERIPAEPSPLNRTLYLEVRHFLADHNLNYTDKAAMAEGVEVRVPFLDRDLMRFMTRVPPRFKMTALGETKSLLRQAVTPLLPRGIIRRPKTGFGAPVRRWIRGELRERVGDVLAPASLARRGWFDPAAVTRLIEDDRAGRVDGAYLVFALLCAELWARMFLDGQGPYAVTSYSRSSSPSPSPPVRKTGTESP